MPSKIRIFLWFNDRAQDAAKFYVSIFRKSRLLSHGPRSASLRLDELELILFNGGPYYKLNPAASLFVTCRTQAEIDYYWEKLSAGGRILRCGWLTDKFGVTWQIMPDILGGLLEKDDTGQVMQAMLKMKKLDISKLKRARTAGR